MYAATAKQTGVAEHLANRHALVLTRKTDDTRLSALRNQRGDGVHYEAARKKWKARYSPLGKSNVFIGRFNTYEEAKTARDRAVNNMEVTD